jgi:large subunit ribosomal protein L20
LKRAASTDFQSEIKNLKSSIAFGRVKRSEIAAGRIFLTSSRQQQQTKKENSMPRVKRGTKRRAKRKKILDRASGYFLTKSKLYRSAKEAVERGLKFAYSGRKQRKRQYRSLWIVRIGAAAKLNGMSYNQFIHGLKLAAVELDRKILADLAVKDPGGFASLAQQAKDAIKVGAAEVKA